MSTPGGGGTGMEYGEDYIAARIAVDVPDGSAQAIREITQEVERFHTTLEAAVHAEADATRYLDQMAESARRTSEAYTQLIQQMETVIQLSARASGAMPAMGPSGAQGAQGTGARVPSASDVASQIQGAASTNEREYLNMQHQRNNISNADMISISPESISDLANKIAQREKAVREQLSHTDGNTDSKVPPGGQGPEDPQNGLAQRIGRASTLAGQVMNEIGPGGSGMGMGNLAMRGLNWMSKRRSMSAPGRGEGGGAEAGLPTEQAAEGEEGGGLGGGADPEAKGLGGLKGLTKYLGPIAGVATSALAIYGLIQKGGGMIQGMRNEASIRGGAAGEGAEVSLRARLAAMNPFITQDQARQLYQAVMSEGYADASGSGADNVIDFMTHNLTTMNISVADSAKMLRSTIVGSGQGDKNSVAGSVQMLGKELDAIRTLSRDGVMSQPDMRAGVMATQQALLAMGGTPEEAAHTAMVAEQVGAGDKATAGQFGRIAGSFANERGSMWLRTYGGPGGTPIQGMPAGLFPQLTGEWLQEHGGYNQAVENSLTAFAKQASVVQGPEENKVYMFQNRLKREHIDTDATNQMNVAKRLYEDIMSGKQSEELKKAEQQVAKQGIGGRSGDKGGGDTRVSGAVTIDLTPQAAQLLTVVGGKQASLTPTQKGANMGISGHQVNDPGVGGL